MKSIFDDDPLDPLNPLDPLTPDTPASTPDPAPKPKRSKHREGLTPSEVSAGKSRMGVMVQKAFDALEEAIVQADHSTAIKAAQILLDRAGFGPKSTVDVNATHRNLSELTREELAERAAQLSAQLRTTPTAAPSPTAAAPSAAATRPTKVTVN